MAPRLDKLAPETVMAMALLKDGARKTPSHIHEISRLFSLDQVNVLISNPESVALKRVADGTLFSEDVAEFIGRLATFDYVTVGKNGEIRLNSNAYYILFDILRTQAADHPDETDVLGRILEFKLSDALALLREVSFKSANALTNELP